MQKTKMPSMKMSACKTIGALTVLAAFSIAGTWTAAVAAANDAMTVAQQNALVQKYCAVCHTDASRNGGLSLEHFDAADVDPGLAAMMVSKLKTGALGASGQKPLPDKATQEAFQSALTIASADATDWVVKRFENPKTRAATVTASIVREAPSSAVGGVSELYRLTIGCNADTQEAEMQVAWSPRVPPSGLEVSAAVDGKMPVTYKIEGGEKMGNGQPGTSGPAAVILYTTKNKSGGPTLAIGLPAETLTVHSVFPNQSVVFPFVALPPTARRALSTCFTGSSTNQ